ncbi:M48 family metalloprotease [Streptomyces sp. E-15]
MSGIGVEAGAQAARSRALAVLRVRGRALAVALLPAGAAVILLTGATTGHLVGRDWDAARWAVGVLAVLVLLAAAGVAAVVARARPATTPTVPVPEESAPDLYRMVRDLADRLDVPVPSAIALTPDCDSWLEDRAHCAHGPPRPAPDEAAGPGRRRPPVAPVLVIGSPFLWWMRVGELRAVLAPVIAGTGPSAHPDIAAARRFVRGLDAAVAVASAPGRRPLTRGLCAALGWVARLLLRGCREHATLMERGVAVAAAERAQAVDYGLRIVAQEQVGLAYAGWDRLLTRVALPAWRMGRWPSRLDAGVVAALTELSRRDRLAEGFTSRLGERPACDLLEEPGAVDEATSLLAAHLFHGGPAEPRPDWAPVDWQAYPEEVVDRTWRSDAARLHRVLDSLGVRPSRAPGAPDPDGPTLSRLLDHLTERPRNGPRADRGNPQPSGPPDTGPGTEPGTDSDTEPGTERSAALAAGLSAELAREEARAQSAQQSPPAAQGAAGRPDGPIRGTSCDCVPPPFPPQPHRTARELLADHVTAMVCCAAVDTAGAVPALDWLDGPSLLLGGERAADLTPRVLSLIEEGDPGPLRDWLAASGIRPEKPVRLV